MPETKSYESIAANVAAVRETMQQAAQRAGRDVSEITLVAATKVQTSDTIRNAIQAGITVCGENRVQELVAHLEDNAYEGARVHFIGHLQTNKVKFVVGKVDMIESIDSTRLMDAVEKQAAKLDIVQDILLEVNIGDEESKGGAGIDEVLPLAQHALSCPHLRLRGLMCIPPATASEEENRGFFQETYQLFVDMKDKLEDNNSTIDCLSMGMSGDYPLAIEGGSTMVRVGTALFGARPPWHPQG
ncbi:MAG: YggS family pyridoxal phosphate-dependent enzyme [Ruminiclostridium sp.]|jgi:pyridoxal phosphate enzyme (YggS family)|nr:YggS family pyridoxal phosphate-dependent enzyme [Ruminiclostridium sp.]MCI9465746.1 YggS family pyridoxal phosphate-dependent enzyme [Ruminiclostridium sp.]